MKLIVLKMENQPSVVCDKQITDGFYFYVKAINKRPKVVEPEEQETVSEESDEQVTTKPIAPKARKKCEESGNYKEMNNIVEVLKSDFSDEHKYIRAAETIHHKLADSVIFDFLVNKVSNEDRINRLLGECLDENGRLLAKRRKTSNAKAFDIEKYA